MLFERSIASSLFGGGTNTLPTTIGGDNLDSIYSNCTQDLTPVLLPNPTPELLSWNNASVILQNLAVIDWSLFLVSLLVPRRLTHYKADFISTLLIVECAAKEAAKGLVGILLIIISSPLVTPIFLFFAILSGVVTIIYWLKYGNKFTKAAPFDAIWGNESDESRPYINVCLTLEGKPSIKKIRKIIKNKLLDVKDKSGNHLYKKFYQKIELEYGYFIWKDAESFDIKNHVRVWQDPLNDITSKNITKNIETTGTEEVVGRYMDTQGWCAMDSSRPKWEVVLLNSNCAQSGKYAVIVRLHHSIGDGVSLMKLVLTTLVDTPAQVPPKVIPKLHPLVWFVSMIYSVCMFPVEFIGYYRANDVNPLHDTTVLSGRKMYRQSKGIALSTLKAIKSATGTTVNDVLMSCVSAALARTFGHRCGSSITSMMPISNHDPVEKLCLINKILMGVLKLPTPLASPSITPHARLLMVKNACDTMKLSPGLLASGLGVNVMSGLLPGPIAHSLMYIPGLTMGASNVPGPQEELSLWGHSISGIVFWVPDRAPTGAGIGMISYCGMVRMGLSMDTAMSATADELEQITEEFENEVNNLYQEVVNNNNNNNNNNNRMLLTTTTGSF